MGGSSRSLLYGFIIILFFTLANNTWGAEPEPVIRVQLLLSGNPQLQVSSETEVCYRNGSGWTPVPDLRLAPGKLWTVSWESDTGKLQLTSAMGDRLTAAHPLRLRPVTPGGSFTLNGHEYGNELQLFPSQKGVEVFNEIGLEEYIAGVLYGETIPGWNIEALKAQAVAARTYALQQIRRHKTYDFCDQTHCQRYRGRSSIAGFANAVSATRGEVLLYRGKLIQAFYHASSGGRTENNDDVWGGEPQPYLRSVLDYDNACDKYSWQMPGLISVKDFLTRLGLPSWDSCEIRPIRSERTQVVTAYAFRRYGGLQTETFNRETIRRKLGLLSPRFEIRRIPGNQVQEALSRLNGGTVRIVKSVPEGETIHLTLEVDVEITGEAIEAPVTLNANEAILISGRGYGHGVGLSQWGSQSLAQMGKGYLEILHHYYGPDVTIEKRYD